LSTARQLNPIYATTTAGSLSISGGRMSYLLQYARRPDSVAPHKSAARVDEYARLNRAGLYGDAFVRVFVEDSTARRRRRGHDPQLVLQIADCSNTINLEFSLETAQLRETRCSRSTRCSARSTASATVSPRRPSLQSTESSVAAKSAPGPERAGSRLFIEAAGSRRHERELDHTNTTKGGASCRI
jgi:hypothetical protein